MNVDAVIMRLRDLCPVFEQRVAGAADFADGLETTANLALPAAYVYRLDDEATPRDTGSQTGLFQVVTERIGVVVAIDNKVASGGDRRGQAAAAQVDTMRAMLFLALLNWQVPDLPGLERAMYYGGGRLLDFDRARLWWQFEFMIDVRITDSDGVLLDADPLREIDLERTDPDTGAPKGDGFRISFTS